MTQLTVDSPWVKEQQRSGLHILAVLLFGFVLFISYWSVVWMAVGFIGFFLATSFKMVWKMLIFMAIIGGLLAVLPFLAPFAIILMIILFCMRIGYVKKNWRPILSGLIVYGSAFFVLNRTMSFQYLGGSIIEPILIAILGTVVLHFVLQWLYINGYSTQIALGIMGSVPLVIIAFILPFLKLHIPGGDAAADMSALHGGITDVNPMVHTSVSGTPVIHTADTIVTNGATSVASPMSSIHTMTTAAPPSISGQAAPSFAPQTTMDAGITNPVMTGHTIQPVNPGHVQQDVYHSHGNVFGGQDVTDSHGSKVISTQKNIFDGQDIYSNDGMKIASTHSNIFNGQDIFDSHHGKIAYTQSNQMGGYDVYNHANQKIGYTTDNGTGEINIFDKSGNKVGAIEDLYS